MKKKMITGQLGEIYKIDGTKSDGKFSDWKTDGEWSKKDELNLTIETDSCYDYFIDGKNPQGVLINQLRVLHIYVRENAKAKSKLTLSLTGLEPTDQKWFNIVFIDISHFPASNPRAVCATVVVEQDTKHDFKDKKININISQSTSSKKHPDSNQILYPDEVGHQNEEYVVDDDSENGWPIFIDSWNNNNPQFHVSAPAGTVLNIDPNHRSGYSDTSTGFTIFHIYANPVGTGTPVDIPFTTSGVPSNAQYNFVVYDTSGTVVAKKGTHIRNQGALGEN